MSAGPGRGSIDVLAARFARLGLFAFDHRWLVLAGCVLLLAVCVALAGRARFDNSFEAYFDTSDPSYRAYQAFRDDFGSDEVAYILYSAPEAAHGPFDLAVMRRIARLTRTLEAEVPFVAQVTSLANAEFMEGVPGGLVVRELLEEFPETQAALLEIRERVLAKPVYVGGLVSADARHAALILDMDRSSVDPLDQIRLDPQGGDGLDNLYPQVSYRAIEDVLARPEYRGIEFHHVGDVPLNAVYNQVVADEMGWLSLVSAGVVGLLLAFFFRRPMGVLGPLLVVGTSTVVALALVGALGWRLDLMVTMLGPLLVAVGVADSVHVLAEFRAYHVQLGDRREAARRTFYLVGPPCLLTSLTTAAGFASMSISPIAALAHFALYSAVGVLAAFLLTVTLLFVLLSFGRRRVAAGAGAREIARAKGGRAFQAALAGLASFDVRHRRAILAAFGLLFAFSAAGIGRLRVDSNFLHEFAEEEPIRVATERVDEVMGGTYSFVYLFDSGEPEGVKSSEFLRDVDRLQREADLQSQVVRKSYSIGDLMKDVNQSFHEEEPAHFALPETRELAAQYLLLYEMSGGEELRDYVSADFARASLELRCKAVATSELAEMAGRLERHLEVEPPRASQVSVTGIGALWLRLQDYITQSQIRGFLLASGTVALLLCAVFQSVRTGLIAMLPNLSPVVLTLGVMGWLDIPLDYVRLLIASVAIGISVDDTIHHVIRFRHEFLRRGSYAEALRASMQDVGRALVITSVVLVAGFLVFLASRLDSNATFGALLAGTIAAALAADLLLMPALVLAWKPWGPERPEPDPRAPAWKDAAPLERGAG